MTSQNVTRSTGIAVLEEDAKEIGVALGELLLHRNPAGRSRTDSAPHSAGCSARHRRSADVAAEGSTSMSSSEIATLTPSSAKAEIVASSSSAVGHVRLS